MRIRLKIFVSFLLAWSFIALSLSGLFLYLSPKGRIANWIQWTFLGYTKAEWTNLHILFASIFLISGIFHLFYFNWKPFWGYIKVKVKKGRYYRYELVVSFLLAILLFGSAIWKIPPFYSLITLNEWIQESFELPENNPPVPHAEELTIREFATGIISLSVDSVMKQLERKGYRAENPEEKIVDLAGRYRVSPSYIYGLFDIAEDHSVSSSSQGAGYGQKTLRQICAELSKEIEWAKRELATVGITDARENETLKQIADRYGVRATEIANIIADADSLGTEGTALR